MTATRFGTIDPPKARTASDKTAMKSNECGTMNDEQGTMNDERQTKNDERIRRANGVSVYEFYGLTEEETKTNEAGDKR